MRIHSAVVSLLFLCAGAGAFAQLPAPVALTCVDLHVVPAPRECMAVEAIPIGATGFSLLTDPPLEKNEKADPGTRSLSQWLMTPGTLEGPMMGIALRFDRKSGPGDAPSIRLIQATSAIAKALLASHQLSFDPAMHDEGYIVLPDDRGGVAIVAETPAGFFYGAQTIRQLIRGVGKDAVLLVPTIRDWPAMPHRGVSDDWSRGPLPNMDFLKREIRTLAAYKYNIFSPYFEHTFAYASTPLAAFPGGAITPDEARELVDYAAKYHIVIIPEQESFGHLHHVLKFEQFSALGETPHGSVLAPGEPATLPQIGAWFGELATVFPGPWAHIGADETFELGLGKTHDRVQREGLGAVYLNFLTQIHATLEPNHKRLLFWGDIAENSPDLVGTLPKDMIAVPWHYDAKPDFTKAIEPFIKAGLETWVAPGVSNWSRLYPNNNEALGNIRAFVRDGQKLGATGMLNTVWNDDGEGIFDENWYGILFGAAASWQPGESSEDSFAASFGQAFHRDSTGKIDQAHQELRAAHAVLRKAGLEDAQDSLFWVDPLSAEGQRVAAKIRPALTELRLHAERAISFLAEAKAAAASDHRALENPEALDAMELGARRIDFVGLKFQSADECAALYARAQAMATDKSQWKDVDELLWTIASNNGRFEDIRDGYALLRDLYQQAWLRDNRPHWLQNNLARYDLSTQLWVGRSQHWHTVMQQWWDTHTLPGAADAGLPEVAK
jgi:hypothetical protein